MSDGHQPDRIDRLRTDYGRVRATTEALAAPLSPEDQTVQSMPDVSPTKWHRAHTSWFFEQFLLEAELPGYEPFHPAYSYIFNSYYEAVGARHPRAERGLVSRPGVAAIADYRRHVDAAMERLLARPLEREHLDLVELGLHHEQQHQELLLMDIKHVFSRNPLQPAYHHREAPDPTEAPKVGWIEHDGGLTEVGVDPSDGSFAFDNESPRHTALLTPFALADRAVTCGDWLEFMADDGYHRPELWLSDGWALGRAEQWEAPLYWTLGDEGWSAPHHPPDAAAASGVDDWRVFTLGGPRAVDPGEPVCHVSYYEADAYAHWTGMRLPTEAEWETIAADHEVAGNLASTGVLHPTPTPPGSLGLFGDTWEWTASAYSPYPGFRARAGAVGEYNGKFMVNQYVLRGGSALTPDDHPRPTYRNFFPAAARWVQSGIRLAKDPD
jgi:ergothioneine biosynthesis protein EgtB